MLNIVKKSKFNDHYMKIALQEAKKAYDQGEVPVGAVLVHKNTGKVITKGHNLVQQNTDATMHAELIVIQNACKKLSSKYLQDCDIYVTLEPCAMCASAISHVKINSLYYGASDVKFGAIENGVRYYNCNNTIHRPDVYSGLLCNEAKMILQKFFTDYINK